MPLFDLDIPAEALARRLLESPDLARSELTRIGFRKPDRALRNLEGLVSPGAFATLPACFFRHLLAAPDLDMALNNVERLSRAVFSRSGFYRTLESRSDTCGVLVRMMGSSQFLADILVRDPEHFYWLIGTPDRLSAPCSPGKLGDELDSTVGAMETLDYRLNAVRRFARRELLRIGAGDLVGGRHIRDVAAELSGVADLCIQKVLGLLFPEMDARYGCPRNADGSRAAFAVIALGKLGGQELNFSSDVDLMFVYSEEGETDGAEDGGRQVSNHEYFSRLAERFVRAVGEPTEEGFLYRIDMRLRPDGASGALTMPLAGYEGYYARRGELWERQMLIKARPCAGSDALGRRFLDTVAPFVYPRHFEVSPAEEIHRIKRRIEDHLGRRGEDETHLKLRSGGIRDIEFIVQCLQLLVGRVHDDARSGNTLEAIGQLRRVSALSEAEAETLGCAYLFFRRVEHRLQMMHGLSDYTLPEAEADQVALARSLGMSLLAYRNAIAGHLTAVQRIYRDVFSEAGDGGEGRSVGALCEIDLGDPEALGVLSDLGFAQPEEAHRNLIFLACGHAPKTQGTRTRQSFMELAPALMQALQRSADPDQGLSNLERLVFAYGAGDTLFRLLASQPGLRDLLLSICAGSQFLINLMVRHPGLLDWLTQRDVLLRERPEAELEAELDSVMMRAEPDEQVATAFNAFKNRELLRIGARDLVGLTDTFETFHALSMLAEAILKRVYAVVYDRLTDRRGRPRHADGAPAMFVILGLGKLGGGELSFGSDLDLVFVYSADGQTDGPEPLDNLQFFTGLAQRILNMLGQYTPAGALYQVDARLRPEGGNAMLVLSYDAYDRYLQRRAATWERLALSRRRVVAGSEAFGRKLLNRIETFVLGEGLTGDEIRYMVDIRRRMEREASRRPSDRLSIKTGPGGIVDIEFIVQTLQIRHGRAAPHLRCPHTLKGLDRLAGGGVLPAQDASYLRSALIFLRTVEKVLRRQDEQAKTRLPEDARALTALARALGAAHSAEFMADLEARMTATRRLFRKYLGG